jgi:hypothetical protein
VTLIAAMALAALGLVPGRVDAAAPSPPAAPSKAPHGISQIVVEHDCFGCATGWSLVLRSDGSATHTVTGNPRHGTIDQVKDGSIGTREFDRLAALLVSRGFFTMKDEYSDPRTADGPWTSIAAVRAGGEKKVFDRGDAGPASLRAIETEIEAVKTRLTLAPPRAR